MPKKQNELNFEKSLQELESLVEKMETGELSLEESLKYFERGVALTRDCQKALRQAEQRVQILVEKEGNEKLLDIDPEGNSD